MTSEEINTAMLALVRAGHAKSHNSERDAMVIAAWLEFVADYDVYDILFEHLGFDYNKRSRKKFSAFRNWIDGLK